MCAYIEHKCKHFLLHTYIRTYVYMYTYTYTNTHIVYSHDIANQYREGRRARIRADVSECHEVAC